MKSDQAFSFLLNPWYYRVLERVVDSYSTKACVDQRAGYLEKISAGALHPEQPTAEWCDILSASEGPVSQEVVSYYSARLHQMYLPLLDQRYNKCVLNSTKVLFEIKCTHNIYDIIVIININLRAPWNMSDKRGWGVIEFTSHVDLIPEVIYLNLFLYHFRV